MQRMRVAPRMTGDDSTPVPHISITPVLVILRAGGGSSARTRFLPDNLSSKYAVMKIISFPHNISVSQTSS